jgi:hypothetical protein
MKVRTLAIVALAFLTMTCSQSPIFHIIATETAPKKPRIEGAPTNMVIFNWKGKDLMFVASGRLHWYGKTNENDPKDNTKKISRWDSSEYGIPQPGEKITSLAVTLTRLYALCIDNQGTNATLRYLESGAGWKTINPYSGYQIQTIYADPKEEQLFVGVRNASYYAILYLNNTNNLQKLKDGTSLLSGALYKDNYFFLSTRGEFFQVDENDFTNKNLSEGRKIVFMGMIKLEDDTIIAVVRDGGLLYEVNVDSLVRMQHESPLSGGIETGKWATGALALWKNSNGSQKRFVAGVQGGLYSTSSSSYSHGYIEFELDPTDGSFKKSLPRRDQGALLSAGDNDRYSTSLGKHPINHLFQAPDIIDDNLLFFASTQTAGLWSYRDRPDNGGWQWNAEE